MGFFKKLFGGKKKESELGDPRLEATREKAQAEAEPLKELQAEDAAAETQIQPEPVPAPAREPQPEPQGPITNEYGDILISLAKFRELVRKYCTSVSSVNGFEYAASDYGLVSGVSVMNNVLVLYTQKGARYYDPGVCRALFLEGNQYYIVPRDQRSRNQGCNSGVINGGNVVQGSIVGSNCFSVSGGAGPIVNGGNVVQGSIVGSNCFSVSGGGSNVVGRKVQKPDGPTGGINKEFDLTGVTSVRVKATSAKVKITDCAGSAAKVVSEGFVKAKIEDNILSVEANTGSSVKISIPRGANLSLTVSSTSGDIDIKRVALKNVRIRCTSGDVAFDGSAINLNAESTSGSLEIYHTYIADGGATLGTTSGNIHYLMRGVQTLNLDASPKPHNGFVAQPDGFVADVNILSTSGSVSVE